MAGPSILSVNIAAANVEAMLFGIFLALAISSLCLLVHRRWKEVNALSAVSVGWVKTIPGMWHSTLYVATLVFIAIITVHWGIGVRRVFDAFMFYNDGRDASDYFNDLEQPLEVARTALLIVTMLTGDVVLIHRAWIVWSRRSWVVILPLLTSLSLIACAIGVLYSFSESKPGDESSPVFTQKIIEWVIGVVVSTLITKVYGTIMIAWRIWTVNKALVDTRLRPSGRSILEVAMIFIESSMLATTWTIFFAVMYATKSAMQSFATSCYPSINGIAFMLITVRVGLGWDLQIGVMGTQHGPAVETLRPFDAYPLRAIQLTVTQTVVQETDFALRSQDSSGGGGAYGSEGGHSLRGFGAKSADGALDHRRSDGSLAKIRSVSR